MMYIVEKREHYFIRNCDNIIGRCRFIKNY